jgi:ferredoxin
MENVIQISLAHWHLFLKKISAEMTVFVPVYNGLNIEYKLFNDNQDQIVYNHAWPVTPLKTFFLPVKKNVVIDEKIHNKRLIVGVPSCDLHALNLLDEIYLDDRFPDPIYKKSREDTILIGTDCHEIREHCHCKSYGIDPYPDEHADATLVSLDGNLLITLKTERGAELFDRCRMEFPVNQPQYEILQFAEERRAAAIEKLKQQNRDLPAYKRTGELVKEAGDDIWQKYARTCVSCGACATICPTCTCFLLIDRPGFDKVRQLDACQYPGFERIAAGEDPLSKKFIRFRNRYLCKYVWKPEKFRSTACTGCGRCIDSCIGKINKNEIFLEMIQPS